MRLARAERQDMVQMLSEEGMSNRAIAPIVGASEPTVRRDVAGASNDAPEPTPVNIDSETGEILDEPIKTAMRIATSDLNRPTFTHQIQ